MHFIHQLVDNLIVLYREELVFVDFYSQCLIRLILKLGLCDIGAAEEYIGVHLQCVDELRVPLDENVPPVKEWKGEGLHPVQEDPEEDGTEEAELSLSVRYFAPPLPILAAALSVSVVDSRVIVFAALSQ